MPRESIGQSVVERRPAMSHAGLSIAAAIFAVVMLAVGCSAPGFEPSEQGGDGSAEYAAPLITEDHPNNSGSHARQLGEACLEGHSECASDLCVKYGPKLHGQRSCTIRCDPAHPGGGDLQCPANWACRQVHPDSLVTVCMPPRDWVPSVTTPRSARGNP